MFIPIRDDNVPTSRPYLTYALITLNVGIFLATGAWMEPGDYERFVSHWGFTPSRGAAPTLLTSMFLHGGWFHLIGNMLFLWIFGDNVEDRLGRAPFLLVYLGTGVAASVAHGVFGGSPHLPCVGASGAIAGVMGCYALFYPKSSVTFAVIVFYRLLTFELPAYVAIGFFFVRDVVSSAVFETNVAYFAHIGGMVAGALVALGWRQLETTAHRGARGAFADPRDGDAWRPRERRSPAREPRKGKRSRAPEPAAAGRGGVGEELDPAELAYLTPPAERPGADARLELDPQAALHRALETEDDLTIACTYQALARRGRAILVDAETLARTGDVLLRGGHETLAADVWRRLIAADAGPVLTADAHLQLAWLHTVPLLDPPLAAHHARRALDLGLDARGEERAREIFARHRADLRVDDAPFALVRLDGEIDQVSEVAEVLAPLLGQLPLDVMLGARHGRGILAVDLDAERARQAIAGLEERGVPVAAVSMKSLQPAPDARPLVEITFSARGFEGKTGDGRSFAHLWEDVGAAGAWWWSDGRGLRSPWKDRVRVRRPLRIEPVSGMPVLASVGHRAPGTIRAVRAGARLDLYLGEPAAVSQRYQLHEGSTRVHFAAGIESTQSALTLQLAAGAILARDEKLFVGPGVAALAGLERPDAHLCANRREVTRRDLAFLARWQVARGAT